VAPVSAALWLQSAVSVVQPVAPVSVVRGSGSSSSICRSWLQFMAPVSTALLLVVPVVSALSFAVAPVSVVHPTSVSSICYSPIVSSICCHLWRLQRLSLMAPVVVAPVLSPVVRGSSICRSIACGSSQYLQSFVAPAVSVSACFLVSAEYS